MGHLTSGHMLSLPFSITAKRLSQHSTLSSLSIPHGLQVQSGSALLVSLGMFTGVSLARPLPFFYLTDIIESFCQNASKKTPWGPLTNGTDGFEAETATPPISGSCMPPGGPHWTGRDGPVLVDEPPHPDKPGSRLLCGSVSQGDPTEGKESQAYHSYYGVLR